MGCCSGAASSDFHVAGCHGCALSYHLFSSRTGNHGDVRVTVRSASRQGAVLGRAQLPARLPCWITPNGCVLGDEGAAIVQRYCCFCAAALWCFSSCKRYYYYESCSCTRFCCRSGTSFKPCSGTRVSIFCTVPCHVWGKSWRTLPLNCPAPSTSLLAAMPPRYLCYVERHLLVAVRCSSSSMHAFCVAGRERSAAAVGLFAPPVVAPPRVPGAPVSSLGLARLSPTPTSAASSAATLGTLRGEFGMHALL